MCASDLTMETERTEPVVEKKPDESMSAELSAQSLHQRIRQQ